MTPFARPRAPLVNRARFAWGFGFTSRQGESPIAREQCRRTLAIALSDPHPGIRRVAGEGARACGPATVYPFPGQEKVA